MGHFVWSPREREKRDRIDSRGDEKEGQGRKENECEGTEEIKTFPLYHYLLQGQQALPNYKPKSVGCPFASPKHPQSQRNTGYLECIKGRQRTLTKLLLDMLYDLNAHILYQLKNTVSLDVDYL